MIVAYKDFLSEKQNFWKLAKQYQFNSIEAVAFGLQSLKGFTTRNSIALRILGLVENLGNDNLQLTEAGNKFLGSKNRQVLLDEQIAKVYLDSFVNPQLHIPVYPALALVAVVSRLGFLSFEEYMMFVCWIHADEEIELVISIVQHYRELNEERKQEFVKAWTQKVNDLGVKDFKDNVYRLFSVFTLASYIDDAGLRYEKELSFTGDTDTSRQFKENVLSSRSTFSEYKEWLQGVQNITTPETSKTKIVTAIDSLSKDERKVIRSVIEASKDLPNIQDINITKVELNIGSTPGDERQSETLDGHTSHTPVKRDYLAIAERNQLLGLHAEKIVLMYEYEKLKTAGRADLIPKVEHVSIDDDGAGYDILSFHDDGSPIHIEVKAVRRHGSDISFFITANEMETAVQDSSFRLYLVLDYKTANPKIWECPGSILYQDNTAVKISPTSYRVTVGVV